MTIAESLETKLGSWKPNGTGPHSQLLGLPEHGWTAHISAERADSLGCSLLEFDLFRDREAPKALTTKGWGEAICHRVTGLLEPLKLIECDAEADQTIIRSDRVTAKAGANHYYELKLDGTNKASLRRYAGKPGEGRHQIPFTLTHEALAKLTEDICQSEQK